MSKSFLELFEYQLIFLFTLESVDFKEDMLLAILWDFELLYGLIVQHFCLAKLFLGKSVDGSGFTHAALSDHYKNCFAHKF